MPFHPLTNRSSGGHARRGLRHRGRHPAARLRRHGAHLRLRQLRTLHRSQGGRPKKCTAKFTLQWCIATTQWLGQLNYNDLLLNHELESGWWVWAIWMSHLVGRFLMVSLIACHWGDTIDMNRQSWRKVLQRLMLDSWTAASLLSCF